MNAVTIIQISLKELAIIVSVYRHVTADRDVMWRNDKLLNGK